MLDALSNLGKKLQRKMAQATVSGQLHLLTKLADQPDRLVIRRSPKQEGDSRPQDPDTPITYVLTIHEPDQDKTLGRIRWNPDQLVEDLQKLGDPIPEGPITDLGLREAIVKQCSQETRQALQSREEHFDFEKTEEGFRVQSEDHQKPSDRSDGRGR